MPPGVGTPVLTRGWGNLDRRADGRARISTVGFGASSRVDESKRARAGLAVVLPRVVELLRSVRDPDACAIGDWRVADVAAHLSHVTSGELLVAKSIRTGQTEGWPVGDDFVAGVKNFNASMLDGDQERDLSVLANRIDKDASEFIATMDDFEGDEPVGWLGGVILPASGIVCHVLSEFIVHGFDIARAEKRPWPIERSDAALAFGFLLDVIRETDPSMRSSFVHRNSTEVSASLDVRIRGAGRAFVVIENGSIAIEEPSRRSITCHISGDPVALLLVAYSRIGPLRPLARGRLVSWGRKPWLGWKLNDMLKSP